MNGDVKIPSRSSPKGSKRGCLCWDSNTYSRECCDGSLRAQGVGAFQGGGASTITHYDVSYANILSFAEQNGYALPSQAQRIEQNAMVVALKNAGIWALLDYFYMFATDGSSDFATINWIDPNKLQATKEGTPIFTSNSGFKSDGSSYLNTHFSPIRDAVKMTPTESSNGIWLKNNLSVDGTQVYRPSGIYRTGGSTTVKVYEYGISTYQTNQWGDNSGYVSMDSGTSFIGTFIEPLETLWRPYNISGLLHGSTEPPSSYTDVTFSWYQSFKIYNNGSLVNDRYRQVYSNKLEGPPAFPNNTNYELYVCAAAKLTSQSGSTDTNDTVSADSFFTDDISLIYGGAPITGKEGTMYTILNSYMSQL